MLGKGNALIKFAVGDHIMYTNNCVCKIDDIRDECFSGFSSRTYYVMHALNDPRSVIYVPVDSEKLVSRMLRLLLKDEILAIIDSSEENDIEWIADTKLRCAAFTELLDSDDRESILKIVKALSIRKRELEREKKKFYASDERILNAALKAINEEFAFVLGIEAKEVIPFILERTGHLE